MNIYGAIVKKQHELNMKTTGENYLEKKQRWNSAIIDEVSELIKSLGYEWWKKTVVDMDNAKVEATDLLHFITSDTLQINYNNQKNIERNFIDETIIEFEKCFTSDSYASEFADKDLLDLMDLITYNQIPRFAILREVFRKLDMSNEMVYISYFTKNCLNKFRQDNGYKTGGYTKMWNGQEDNVTAFNIASRIGATEDLFDKLYEELDTYYKTEVKKDNKVISFLKQLKSKLFK